MDCNYINEKKIGKLLFTLSINKPFKHIQWLIYVLFYIFWCKNIILYDYSYIIVYHETSFNLCCLQSIIDPHKQMSLIVTMIYWCFKILRIVSKWWKQMDPEFVSASDVLLVSSHNQVDWRNCLEVWMSFCETVMTCPPSTQCMLVYSAAPHDAEKKWVGGEYTWQG